MHPVIKIIALIILCLLVSSSKIPALITGFSLVAALYAMTSCRHLYDVLLMVQKLKWFFISIMALYFWFTPGESLSGLDSDWIPTEEGLIAGLTRASALLLIIMAVNIFLKTTPRTEMISALIWLAYPLRIFGIHSNRFAIRITLAMQAVTQVQSLYEDTKANKQDVAGSKLTRISKVVSNVFCQVIDKAETASCRTMQFPEPAAPPIYQWAYLPVVVLIFWMADLL